VVFSPRAILIIAGRSATKLMRCANQSHNGSHGLAVDGQNFDRRAGHLRAYQGILIDFRYANAYEAV
jgi:hypothetical protein